MPASVVRDFVHLDAQLTMKLHLSRVISSCFLQLMRLHRIRCSIGEEVAKRLITALVLSRLHYCTGAPAGLPVSTVRPLQRIQTAAAILVANVKSSNHITLVLWRLHWAAECL